MRGRGRIGRETEYLPALLPAIIASVSAGSSEVPGEIFRVRRTERERHYDHVSLRNESRVLKRKSLSSMRTAMTAFNSYQEDGRVTAVLLHLQHAFEMLLKAALVQGRVNVFDKQTGRSIGFDKCLRQAQQSPRVKLTEEEAGTMRAIDAMRDDEQHWFTVVDEGLLYLHGRASVTLYDALLHRTFGERLADHLPVRVLPISIDPPQDFQTLVDREYAHVAELLKPGRRARAEAKARVRTLLAMEAHVEPETRVSNTDVNRVVKGIREGKSREQVFPRLSSVDATVSGTGLSVEVRFVKEGGLPVRFAGAEDQVDASAVRVVDLQRKYHRSPGGLAHSLGLTGPRATALRKHLGIDDDDDCRRVFEFGAQRHVRYSDNAFTRLRDALRGGLDMTAVWQAHRPRRSGSVRPACAAPGCVSAKQEGDSTATT